MSCSRSRWPEPAAVAVVYEARSLDVRAAQRAGQPTGALSERAGRGTGPRVAICMERGLEMMVGMLGIMKCGGALCAAGSGLSRRAPGVPAEG